MTDTINFGDALAGLKEGKRVARAGWNGKGMWLEFVAVGDYAITTTRFFSGPEGSPRCDRLPWIGMKTADDKFVPWLASQTDMLADDWQVLD